MLMAADADAGGPLSLSSSDRGFPLMPDRFHLIFQIAASMPLLPASMLDLCFADDFSRFSKYAVNALIFV